MPFLVFPCEVASYIYELETEFQDILRNRLIHERGSVARFWVVEKFSVVFLKLVVRLLMNSDVKSTCVESNGI